MRFLFLAYIVGMALFGLATVVTDSAQVAELAAEAKAKEDRVAKEAAVREARAKELRRRKMIEDRCDQLAGNTYDRNRNRAFPGVAYDILRLNAPAAIKACRTAVAENANNDRFQYQLARALQAQKNPEAKPLLVGLTQRHYPVAYDNLGWWHFNAKDFRSAISYFREGVRLNDPESMVSLSRFLLEGRYVQKNEREAMQLLADAETYGHPTAILAMEKYRQQQRMSVVGITLFAAVLGELLKR